MLWSPGGGPPALGYPCGGCPGWAGWPCGAGGVPLPAAIGFLVLEITAPFAFQAMTVRAIWAGWPCGAGGGPLPAAIVFLVLEITAPFAFQAMTVRAIWPLANSALVSLRRVFLGSHFATRTV